MQERLVQPRLGEQSYTIQLTPNVAEPESSAVYVRPRRGRLEPQPASKVALKPTDEGYVFELSVAKSLLTDVQGEDWTDFQLNVVLRDVDELTDRDAFVSWRMTPDARNRNSNYAFFFRNEQN